MKGILLCGTGAALLFLSGCVTLGSTQFKLAETAYQAQDWDNAMSNIVVAMQMNSSAGKPPTKKFVELYNLIAPKYNEQQISLAEAAAAAKDWDRAVMHYDNVSKSTEMVRATGTLPVEHPDFSAPRSAAAQEAATVHYARGKTIKGDAESQEAAGQVKAARETYKKAAKELRLAFEFVMGFQDSQTLYEECRQKAIQRVAVLPFTESGTAQTYRGLGETLSDSIISKCLESSEKTEFMELISRDQFSVLMSEHNLALTQFVDAGTVASAGKILGIHSVVVGKINTVSTNYPPDITSRKTGEGTVTRTVYSNKKAYTVEQFVRCAVTFYKRMGEAMVDATYQVIDVETAQIQKTGHYQGKAHEEFEWARYSGDEEALAWVPGARQLCAAPEQMIADALNQVAVNNSDELAAFFNQ